MSKDWTGNSKTLFSMIGASNHAIEPRRADDYYATEPKATECLLGVERFSENIWECACGGGHMADTLSRRGYTVRSTDLVDRGYGEGGVDFLEQTEPWNGDIITNPPYKYAQEFIEHALDLVGDGHKVAMFLKLTFLESRKRQKLFRRHPPKYIYVFVKRVNCRKNGEFEKYTSNSRAVYSWFVWEKGFKGEPVVRWINGD